MRIRVTSRFRDKFTREHYEAGRVLTLPDDRALDAIAKGCAELLPEPEEKPKRKPGRPPKDKAARPTEDK